MPDDAGNLGLTNGADFTVETLAEVEASSPQLPSPAEITDAVLPVLVAGKGRVALGSIADEAADGVGVETEQERDEEVVSVPEGLE